MPLWLSVALWFLWFFWTVVEVICLRSLMERNAVNKVFGVKQVHYTRLSSLVTTGWVIVSALWLSYNLLG